MNMLLKQFHCRVSCEPLQIPTKRVNRFFFSNDEHMFFNMFYIIQMIRCSLLRFVSISISLCSSFSDEADVSAHLTYGNQFCTANFICKFASKGDTKFLNGRKDEFALIMWLVICRSSVK